MTDTQMHWHATWNTPGYLPESEPILCDTRQSAWELIMDELARWRDDADEIDPSDSWNGFPDSRFARAIGQAWINRHGTSNDSVHLNGPTDTHLGWVFTVTECTQPISECDPDHSN